mmetsp:Transcript_61807/g.110315  ORF Transcript_61807/g.110315 Transcript_61807/m.110315 type:complete len:87 (-) Transcript_61807:585-845(-)
MRMQCPIHDSAFWQSHENLQGFLLTQKSLSCCCHPLLTVQCWVHLWQHFVLVPGGKSDIQKSRNSSPDKRSSIAHGVEWYDKEATF